MSTYLDKNAAEAEREEMHKAQKRLGLERRDPTWKKIARCLAVKFYQAINVLPKDK